MLPLLQILGLVLIALLLIWLVLRARRRAAKRRTPPTVSTIVAAAGPTAESNGAVPELGASSNGAEPEVHEPEVHEPEVPEPEVHEPEAELREIYDKVGHPDSFDEANEKVTALAGELVERDGIEMDEALRIAYGRSLDEHREYLAAKGLA